jgi:hypothetical protein
MKLAIRAMGGLTVFVNVKQKTLEDFMDFLEECDNEFLKVQCWDNRSPMIINLNNVLWFQEAGKMNE